MMKEFKQIISGSLTMPQYAAALFYAVLMAFLVLLLRGTKRDPASPRTPFHWDWKFFWCDNIRKIIGTAVLILLCIRLCQRWMKGEYLIYISSAIGLIGDALSEIMFIAKDVITGIAKKYIQGLDKNKITNETKPDQ